VADSPLQKAPSGLLGLFDLKTQGYNPNLFGDRVTPVVDVRAFYGVNNLDVLSTSSAGSATASTLVFTVPDLRIYRVLGICGLAQCGVGAVFATDLNIGVVINRTFAVVVDTTTHALRGVTTTVSEEFTGGLWFDEPPILGPGWQFGVRFGFTTTGSLVTQNVRAIVENLPL